MVKIIVGFTGTQGGMTPEQKYWLHEFFAGLVKEGRQIEFHHGDCLGADEEAHDIARIHTEDIVIHPPVKTIKRAYCKARTILPPKDYLERNYDIVEICQLLIGTPKDKQEVQRSGTWSTVRAAKRMKRPTIIVLPDGKLKQRFFPNDGTAELPTRVVLEPRRTMDGGPLRALPPKPKKK